VRAAVTFCFLICIIMLCNIECRNPSLNVPGAEGAEVSMMIVPEHIIIKNRPVGIEACIASTSNDCFIFIFWYYLSNITAEVQHLPSVYMAADSHLVGWDREFKIIWQRRGQLTKSRHKSDVVCGSMASIDQTQQNFCKIRFFWILRNKSRLF
jgi:hypothetical protein